ncbi:MAG TPA: 50S ribosomal protein L34e [Candidatus Eisenbacteria bacterium]|nr:50S ribosomal protein L34e [Candidatus Eisenbacteria bacterium]
MPRPSERTRSRKRVTKPLPGGRTGTLFKGEAGARLRCSICSQELAGVPNTSKTRKLNQSKKTVRRPYGGQLCANCLKTAFKQAVRAA